MSTHEDSGRDLKFIVDHNVARLARWLRMMGHDTVVFDQPDDWEMVRIALAEDRIILTRDTGVMKRRVITSGKIKALLVEGDDPGAQMRQVISAFGLKDDRAFTRCIECNGPLLPVSKDAVKDQIPPYVFKTQEEFVQCQACHRVYWRGTHWQAMLKTLEELRPESQSQ